MLKAGMGAITLAPESNIIDLSDLSQESEGSRKIMLDDLMTALQNEVEKDDKPEIEENESREALNRSLDQDLLHNDLPTFRKRFDSDGDRVIYRGNNNDEEVYRLKLQTNLKLTMKNALPHGPGPGRSVT